MNDWEVTEIARFLQLLSTFPRILNGVDKPIWLLHNKGVFTVKSFYWKKNNNQSTTGFWPWKQIWKVTSPLKVSCFVWLTIRRACLTHEVLQGKRMQICSRCFMCDQDAESNFHLFLHCKTATKLWDMFLNILGVSWVMPKSTMELLNCWKGISSRGSKENWWMTIPACIWWTLWKERNTRCFEGKSSNIQKIQSQSLSLLYFWCKQELGDIVALVDFIGNL
ncbi:hypothetical protein MTR67_047970 [Solanum verrucosum]|uniref:Reverse transcriptase zinc-binding domain-containing protein n=1 Tax=Solanum verrucosum TaxID=315347 RepID=A0AAF0UYS4_SOLVR|nr:hypothetical protein MTR67_047970 [Solanum verrucosum]